MKTVYFVRHGESFANAGGITMEDHLIPLTNNGRKQAAQLAAYLDIAPSRVYTSPLKRTQETAEPFCNKHDIMPRIEPLLKEMAVLDPALIEGMTGEERRPIAAKYWTCADPALRMGNNADTFNSFAERVSMFTSSALGAMPNNTVLFGHGIWLAMFIWQQLGYQTASSEDMRRFRGFQTSIYLPNCALYRLEENNGHYSVTFQYS